MTFRTRFAPSPTGPLHLGHAYSAILGHDMARAAGGEWLLRIEDIDRQRSKPEWEAQIYDDLRWLGLWWPEPVMRQSERTEVYQRVVRDLWRVDAAFACNCRRSDVIEAASAPQGGGLRIGPDGPVYPGTCEHWISRWGQHPFPISPEVVMRLHMGVALADSRSGAFEFRETGEGGEPGLHRFTDEQVLREIGDVVLLRRGFEPAYHLASVVDDHAQGITHVVRGADLSSATRIHVVLQQVLGLRTPVYHHHRLITDDTGKRLAKRDDAKAIARYRAEGATPQDIRRMVGL